MPSSFSKDRNEVIKLQSQFRWLNFVLLLAVFAAVGICWILAFYLPVPNAVVAGAVNPKFNSQAFTQLVAASLTAIAFIYSAITIRKTILYSEQNIQRERGKLSYDFLFRHTFGECREDINTINTFFFIEDGVSIKDNPRMIADYILDEKLPTYNTDKQVEFRRAVSRVLNFYELIATALKHKDLKEDIMLDYLEYILKSAYSKFSLYIAIVRAVDNEPRAYLTFTTLVENWDQVMEDLG